MKTNVLGLNVNSHKHSSRPVDLPVHEIPNDFCSIRYQMFLQLTYNDIKRESYYFTHIILANTTEESSNIQQTLQKIPEPLSLSITDKKA